MIDYIKGAVAELTPAYVVVDNQGMGYMVNISLTTYNQLHKAEKGGEVKVYIYEAIREDAHVLYGFAEKRERELFMLLISVSGVGPNTARMIQSSLSVSDLEQAIASGNVASMKAVKGVGAKTAQRIIVDLKDKIKMPSVSLLDSGGSTSDVFEEALAALVMLGFSQAASQKALNKLFKENASLSVEDAIKRALKMM